MMLEGEEKQKLLCLAEYGELMAPGAVAFVRDLTDETAATVFNLMFVASHVAPPTAEMAKEVQDLLALKAAVAKKIINLPDDEGGVH